MIIKNSKILSTNSKKIKILSIMETGFEAALPGSSLEKIIKRNYLLVNKKKIHLKKYDKIFAVGIGKAAHSMVHKIDSLTKVDGGLVIVPKTTMTNLAQKFAVIQSGHPIPTQQSVFAAKKILHFLNGLTSNDFVIFLISGGASSLVALPDGITLAEKQKVTNLMLKCGASIAEINCIRKHLSQIKGGKLVKYLKSDAVSLVISDVVGDDLSTIASGITYCDKTTFFDAQNIIKKYGLQSKIPKNVLYHINLGVEKKIPETPKKEMIKNHIILSNKNSLDAMQAHAKRLGFTTKVLSCVSGDVQDVGIKLAKTLSDTKLDCIIFGGESTVIVKGNGMGGRNQELVLHLVSNLAKQDTHAIVISVGTDGIDGNTNYAGAIWQSDDKINHIPSYLRKNNSYNFFKKYGGLVFTGPTGTNLMDIGLILRC